MTISASAGIHLEGLILDVTTTSDQKADCVSEVTDADDSMTRFSYSHLLCIIPISAETLDSSYQEPYRPSQGA